MCGIAGFSRKNFPSDFSEKIGGMLAHRGPDFTGYWEDESISLVHTRLSIIEVSKAANQPMHAHGRIIVFNGEIYNFKDIRNELIDLGYVFELHSDTEVILKAFDYWGTDCFDKLNGMFAIAIYDPIKMRLVLARDRYGVKPLYYFIENEHLLFASELAPFLVAQQTRSVLDNDSLADYLRFGYVTNDNSILKKVKKVSPGKFIEIEMRDWKCTIKDFILNNESTKKVIEIIDETENKIFNACQSRLIADVPVGLLLSGGYDSSMVSYASSRINGNLKSYTIGFNNPNYDESKYAEKVSEIIGVKNKKKFCSAEDALEMIKELPRVLSEPMADSSIIPTMLISKFASSEVKVVLSADGGDELFAGYEKYKRVIQLWSIIKWVPFRGVISKIAVSFFKKKNSRRMKKIAESIASQNPVEVLESVSSIFTVDEIKDLLKVSHKRPEMKKKSKYQDMQSVLDVDIANYLCEDIMVKVDRASMAFGLEAREPLLDKRLVEFARHIPFGMKLTRTGEKKHILKKIVHKYFPEELMNRPKMGFSVPMSSWLRNELSGHVNELFDEEFLNQQNIFNTKWVIEFIEKFNNRNHDDHEKVWTLLMFQIWYRYWYVDLDDELPYFAH